MSAGILMHRRANRGLEVLLAHPGGPWFARKDAGAWTIPKGEPAAGEELVDTARREFTEETGIAVPRDLVPLGSIRQKGGKVVRAWAAEGAGVTVPGPCSNTFELEWPPRSGKRQRFPEVDRVEWFDLAEARRRINPAQVELLDRLERLGSGT